MSNKKNFPHKERRAPHENRILWIAPENPALSPPSCKLIERRLDNDGAFAALNLASVLREGAAVGLLFGVLMADGHIEMGLSGALYDNPLLASGLAADLAALADGWQRHPADYVPRDDASD